MLILGLLLAGAGIYYLFYLAGAIPVQLAVILGIVLFFSILAILGSVILRWRDLSPGEKLERASAPALWGLVDAVARKLQIPAVDTIYITPYAEIAVNEKAGLLRRRARGQRNLLIGMGVLPALTQGQLASALAHEYGHFYHGDTAGDSLAHKAYASLEQLAFRMAQSGLARPWNPVWLFILAYQRIFLRVTLGASRLREILADRYAAMAYGRQNFVDGLQNIVRQTLAFQLHADFEVRRSFSLNRPISNIYQLPMEEKVRLDLETQLNEGMKRKTSPYDSHPALPERIALVERLRIPYYPDQDNPAPALDLLPDLDELQRRLTSQLMRNARRK
jgi:Zn-dependent protease with chaperone function